MSARMQETKHVVHRWAGPAAGLGCERECKCRHPPGAAETGPARHWSRPTVRPCDLGRSPSQFDSEDQLLEVCQSKVGVQVSWFRVCCVRVDGGRVSLIRLCYVINSVRGS